MNRTPPVVLARGLEKAYGPPGSAAPVLRGVDLEVLRGECTFLAGPSGSGKTTLLSLLGCVLTPDAGRLEILGADVGRLDPARQAEFRRDRIGFVFQRFHLFAALSALDNVRVPLDLQGRPRSESDERCRRLLEAVGLADKARQRINRLSMGQRQRVAVARALAADPDLILADEPTASLDAVAGRQAMELLKRLCHELGKTVVVVTHDARIFPLADRILTLADGRLVNDRRSSERRSGSSDLF